MIINESIYASGISGAGFDPTLSPASYNVQGPYPGYTYGILPITDELQMKPSIPDNEYYIHPGCTVRGVGIKHPDKHFTGVVQSILKNEKGEIIGLRILSMKTARLVTIRADENLELIVHDELEQSGFYKIEPSNTMTLSRQIN